MTICIAAFCDYGQTLVLASDKLLGLGFVSAEFAIGKTARIHPNWGAMIAGNDVSPTPEILEPVRRSLKEKTKIATGEVVSEVVDSYRRIRIQKAEALFLQSRGWTLDEFKANGKASFPDFYFREIESNLQNYSLELQIMLAGFGDDGGIIATVDNPGISTQRDMTGFNAIGSGYFGAISSLFERELHIHMELQEVLFYVYEAKVAAEKATGVGMETDLFVLRSGGKLMRVPENSIDALESLRLQMARRELTDRRKERVAAEILKLEEVKP